MPHRSILLSCLCALLYTGTPVSLAQTMPKDMEEDLTKVGKKLPPQPYAVSSVRVSAGGSPVKGVDNGQFYGPSMGENCWPTELPSIGILAGTLSEPVSLEVSIQACEPPVNLPPIPKPFGNDPQVTCTWSLKPFSANDPSCRKLEVPKVGGTASWTGFQGQIELPLIQQTGAYSLILNCAINGLPSPPPIGSYLYVTYAEPLEVFSPPEEDWYSKAACWASGQTLDNSESDVIDAVLTGLYDFGQHHWYYGYANQGDEDGEYTFEISKSDAGTQTVYYDIKDETLRPKCTSVCKCYWQGMVARASPCNFGDCYVFSDVLQAISGVMGVGGLGYVAITGEAGLGFLTEPSQSLDPKFTASVACADHEEVCYPYFFTSHSLRGRDETYYDATFKHTYTYATESVALSKQKTIDDRITFLQSDRVLYATGSQYGSWNFYGTLPSELALSLVQTPDFIRLTGENTFTPTDANKDGIYDYLVAEVGVDIVSPGAYLIRGLLTKEVNGNVEIVAHQPSYWSSERTTALVSGPPGPTSAKLYFSGQEIFQSGLNGPYLFHATTHGSDFKAAVTESETEAYKHLNFGELEAGIEEGTTIEGVDTDGNGVFDELKITVPIAVRTEASWAIGARLAKAGSTIGYAGVRKKTAAGNYPVELLISGERIADRGLDGPWDLTLVLYNGRLMALLDVQLTLDGHRATQFE